MSYADVLKISESFKTSINIEFDLLNDDKLSKYIPTSDICGILTYYFSSIEDSKINRSTILEGPYGKGKSYLVLSLLQIMYLNEDNQNLTNFLNKASLIDLKFVEQVKKIKRNGTKLLPVVVNSNYVHLNQSLNIALKEALSRIGLETLFPDTAYDVALNIISKWEKYNDINDKIFDECVKVTGINLKKIKKGLAEYSYDCYDKFIKLYNCINKIGQDFNPFSSNNVVKNYEDIAFKLKSYGYNGIFIVFDEFSKFIEADNDSLTTDLNLLQDLSEKVSRSTDVQMHLCCITHKPLSSYYKGRKSEIANALKTVEGRFKEIRFNRSLSQNYEIIALSLNKLSGFDEVFEREYSKNKKYYSLDSELFGQTSKDIIEKGCFPLNPLSTYSAIQVSEMVAQNERTLFTLISDTDPNSLASFIRRNNEGLYNVDNIYDYFSSIFEKSEDEDVRSLNYKTQTALLKVDDDLSIRILKVLSIIKLINNSDGYVANEENISKSICCDIKTVKDRLSNLVEKGLIKKSFSNGFYNFAVSGSKEIDEQVNSILNLKGRKIDIVSSLNELFPSSVLPRKYNMKHKMIRFYKQMYIYASDLVKLKSFSVFFDRFSCDGFIFNVVMDSEIALAEKYNCIKEHERIILKVPKHELPKPITEEIFRISALKQLLSAKTISDDSREEIRLIIENEVYELEDALGEIYSGENICIISCIKDNSYNEILSNVFEKEYYISPLINNEMINKNSPISSQYLKPRNYVVDLYLNNKVEEINRKSETGPEVTVFNSVDPKEPNTRTIIEIIKCQLEKSEGKKLLFSNIYDLLIVPPYGVRKGVIPLLLAIAVNQMSANLVICFDKKEVPLNANTINKMMEKPGRYSFELERGSKKKTEYIKGLSEVFKIELSGVFADDVSNVSETIRKWIFGMPNIARNCTQKNNYLFLDDDILAIKEIFYGFDINPYEAVFKKLPSVYEYDYGKTLENLKTGKRRITTRINNFEISLSNDVKKLFGASSKASLNNVFADYILLNKANNRFLEDKEKAIVKYFDEGTYDDSICINGISQILFKTKVTDWEKNHRDDLINYLSNMIRIIPQRKLKENSSSDIEVKKEELSKMAILLKNQIQEAFDEFNGAVSNEEKTQILVEILKEFTD